MKSITITAPTTTAKEYFLQQVQMVKVRNAKALQSNEGDKLGQMRYLKVETESKVVGNDKNSSPDRLQNQLLDHQAILDGVKYLEDDFSLEKQQAF